MKERYVPEKYERKERNQREHQQELELSNLKRLEFEQASSARIRVYSFDTSIVIGHKQVFGERYILTYSDSIKCEDVINRVLNIFSDKEFTIGHVPLFGKRIFLTFSQEMKCDEVFRRIEVAFSDVVGKD